MELDARLRKLARNNYWQSLYRASKENHGIQVFENINKFSGIQMHFLYWLSTYDLLYTELIRKENNFLTEAVIKDNIRCDAYLAYRQKLKEAEQKQYNAERRKSQTRIHHPKKHKGNMIPIDVDLRSE